MKVAVLKGSPRGRKSYSSRIADAFVDGARSAGCKVDVFDTGRANIHPCIGCMKCDGAKAPCVFDDDFTEIGRSILDADVVVYATPLYYHAPSPQLLSAVSRLHGIDDLVRGTGKRAYLFVTGYNPDASFMDGVKAWWSTDLRYLGWQDAGTLFVHGVQSRDCEALVRAIEQAREIGARLEPADTDHYSIR